MSERTSYTPGTPCWVDLAAPRTSRPATSFYRELFGWEMPELPNSAELGGYRRAKKDGKDVAGVSPRMQEGQPTGLDHLRLGRGRRGDRWRRSARPAAR